MRRRHGCPVVRLLMVVRLVRTLCTPSVRSGRVPLRAGVTRTRCSGGVSRARGRGERPVRRAVRGPRRGGGRR
ncbi:hypothetical protein SBD_1747 [Streptomyces bottropensis ATCC 25435]|uniref:Uncharacterized protein n=1 Tax=Streptomyces bottropensis ATCC 25435 TaxID=1054862 RepID=M3FVA7_9ACTN|nr:hypothetical protein SBD_1747 [Streptomyces bottropensis ATCC 25435]